MLIVYDGVCNFCNRWVRFVARRDYNRVFTFASAKSPTGSSVMRAAGLDPENPESIILVDGNQLRQKSEAVLTILSRLDSPWPATSTLRIFPKSFRDFCYVILQHIVTRSLASPLAVSCRPPSGGIVLSSEP